MTQNERVSAAALFTVLVALFLVGLVSGTIVRHAVQTLPVLIAGLAVVIRPTWSRFAAMPVFAFWLFIMLLIWLYLLGLPSAVTGQFTAAEVSLTVVIGLACVLGLGASTRKSIRSKWWMEVAAFIMFGALQVGAMWLSLKPAFASR